METRTNSKLDISKQIAREICQPLPLQRQLFSQGMTGLAFLLTIMAVIPLFSVLWEIIRQGLPGLQLAMLTKPVIENGFANAIIGTVIMVGIASFLSIPIGVFTGIFLAEFGQKNRLTDTVRFLNSILTGVPSIVVGVFAYGVVVLVTKQFSAFAGGFALAVIMLPVVVLTTEEALKLIPAHQRLASAALGGTRVQTTFRIVVAAALPSITTGILLAVARAAGETAPLLFTALFSQNWSESLGSPTASLSVLIFNLYSDPDPEKTKIIWTASLVLVGMVLCMNLISRLITRKS